MLGDAAAPPVVAHGDLDHAPLDAQHLDHHLGRERRVVADEVVADLAIRVAPDRPVGAADVGETRLAAPPECLDQLPDRDVAPAQEAVHVRALLDHLPRRARADHHVGVLQELEQLAEVLGAEGGVALDQDQDVPARLVHPLPKRVAVAAQRTRVHGRAELARDRRRPVARAVVHDDDLVDVWAEVADDVPDRGRLVVGGDDHAHAPGGEVERPAEEVGGVQVLDRVHVHVVAGEHEGQHRRPSPRRVIDDLGQLEAPGARRARGLVRVAIDLGREEVRAAADVGRGRPLRLLDQRRDAPVVQRDGVVLPDHLRVLGRVERAHGGAAVGERAERGVVRSQVELVAEEHDERLPDGALDCEQRGAEPALEVAVLDVLEREPEPAAVAVRFTDALAQVTDDHDHVLDAERVAHELEVAGEERLPGHLEHHLGEQRAARMDTSALAGRRDHADARAGHRPLHRRASARMQTRDSPPGARLC